MQSARLTLFPTTQIGHRLKNRKQIAAASAAASGGCILLLQRGGGSSFADKAWRALQACPGVAAVVIGNNQRDCPHAVFGMPGAWPPRAAPAPTSTAAAAAAAAATASVVAAAGAASEVPPVPIVMISYAAHQALLALLKLEGDFGSGAGGPSSSASSRLLLDVRLEPLRAPPSPGDPRTRPHLCLCPFELGPAIRQAVRANDHELLRALLGQIQEQEEEATAQAPLPYAEADEQGLMVLHVAVDAVECLGQLLQRPGIAPILNTPNSRGRRPVHVAAEQDRGLALALLLAAGAYVDAPTDDALGWTALHFAARAGAIEAVQVLLRAGATLDYRAVDGSTPFVVAALSGHASVAEALLAAGANPFLCNMRGKRPSDCVDAECARLLAQYEEQAVSTGRTGGYADAFHWSAAPWLSGHDEEPEVLLMAAGGGMEGPVRVTCFTAGTALLGSMHGGGGGGTGRTCAAVLPIALLQGALREEAGGSYDEEEAAEGVAALERDLRAIARAAPDPAMALVRAISRAARAGWVAGVPSPGVRSSFVMVELPASCRRALWLGALTGQVDGVGPEAVEDEWLCQGSPVRSPAIGERVRCLFEDLRRTRIPSYCSGPGMDRVRRLVLLWLRSEAANDYRQGLTFLACPILETFPPQQQEHAQGW